VSIAERDIFSRSNNRRVVEVDGGTKPSGAEALKAAYIKYGWSVPEPVAKAATTATPNAASPAVQSGSVQATDLPNDKAYYVPVTVGQQKFLLNMDTGSSDLWVFSSAMPKSQRGTHPLYKLEGDLLSGETWDIEYAEGSGNSRLILSTKAISLTTFRRFGNRLCG
jgi:aspergillopepsin I